MSKKLNQILTKHSLVPELMLLNSPAKIIHLIDNMLKKAKTKIVELEIIG
jgi:hypothetical protein